ncbi:hypothetical protein [Streptomyces gossypiisoli]|uniref:hypothetical protein n=1 Tax=Streptomyces gossypiisoli TaxID=2748864 RepID=UPI0015DB1601|nr:hypothetical protein [Streptomyces gossypiisoli]
MNADQLRACAEHEAAHAVVSLHHRITVYEIGIRANGSGYTTHAPTSVRSVQAAITAAGDLWQQEYGTVPYTDLSCHDLLTMEREHGLGALWAAQRDARRVLIQRRRSVLDLADRLMKERSIRLAIPPAERRAQIQNLLLNWPR